MKERREKGLNDRLNVSIADKRGEDYRCGKCAELTSQRLNHYCVAFIVEHLHPQPTLLLGERDLLSALWPLEVQWNQGTFASYKPAVT